MGSIRKRGPGRFELLVYDPAIGKQRSRTYRHHRPDGGERAASHALREFENEVSAGKFAGAGTLAGLVDRYVEHARALGRSPNTIRGYEVKARGIRESSIAGVALSKLTAEDLDGWYAERISAGWSPANVLAHHRLIAAALHQGQRWRTVTSNAAQLARPPRGPRPEISVPSPDELARIIDLAGTELGAVIAFAAVTGMRRGELCGLQWSDVDWDARSVTVTRSIYQVGDKVGQKAPKSHQRRRVALGDVGRTVLSDRLSRAQIDAQRMGVRVRKDGFVFSADPSGSEPTRPDTLTQAFARVCDRTGVKYRFHDLRHFSATQLIAAGLDARTVATRLGHADPALTLRVYSHQVNARDEDAAAVLGAFLSPGSTAP